MNLPAQFFPAELLWLANLVFAFVLGTAAWRAPWRKLLDNAPRINALVGLSLGVFMFWQVKAGMHPGINHHLLGATLFVLMFGWRIAFSVLSLLLLITMVRGNSNLLALGINGLVIVGVPVLFSEMLLRFSQRYLPKRFFIFVLGNGFMGAILSMAVTVFAIALLLAAFSPYNWVFLQHDYLSFTHAIAFTEGFATGMLITAFTAFMPEAVFNFDIEAYLTGK